MEDAMKPKRRRRRKVERQEEAEKEPRRRKAGRRDRTLSALGPSFLSALDALVVRCQGEGLSEWEELRRARLLLDLTRRR